MEGTHWLHQQKIAKGIGVIIKARKLFDKVTLLSLYNSLILPYLSYCIHIWGKCIPNTSTKTTCFTQQDCKDYSWCSKKNFIRSLIWLIQYIKDKEIVYVCCWFLYVYIWKWYAPTTVHSNLWNNAWSEILWVRWRENMELYPAKYKS